VDTSEISADINVNALQGVGSEPPAFLGPFLKADALVPSEDKSIVSLASAIRKKDKNPFRQMTLASQWVFSNIALDESANGHTDDALSALKNNAGGMRALTLIDCALLRAMGIPAVPVSGFLVTDDMRLIPHYWGRILPDGHRMDPLRPSLGDGECPFRFCT